MARAHSCVEAEIWRLERCSAWAGGLQCIGSVTDINA
jgi:hypothetical protein